MAVFSASDLDRFTPPAQVGQPNAPVYLVAPMNFREKARFRAQIAAEGVRFPSDEEFVRVTRELLTDIAPSNLDELLEVVSAFEDLARNPVQPIPDGEGLSEDDQAAREADLHHRVTVGSQFDRLMDQLRQHPVLSQLLALRTLFNQIVPPIAAAYALRGWENVAIPFRRVNGVVPDEVLDAMMEADLVAVGNRALELQAISRDQRGN